MILRRLCSLVALGALVFSSGCCCCHHHCDRPVMFPRLHAAYCGHGQGCCESACSTCCHGSDFAGAPVMSSPEPAIASLPMPRPTPMK
jgi:hypothetical protein